MTDTDRLDSIRATALRSVDRAERNFKLAFFGGALFEVGFLALYLVLADLSNRLHVLLLLAAVATYSIVILGMFALGAHITRNTLRLLKALDATR